LTGWEKDAGEDGAWLDDLENELQEGVAKGTVKISHLWDEIAEWIGVKPEVLKTTVEQYNSFCDKSYDADFLKDKEFLLPLRTPPYYAVVGAQGYDTTLGGIKIDHRMEVVGKQGNLISGLFAAGDNASGWDYASYNFGHPGSALCFALCSGFIAGENAAKHVSG
jgi:fumarate reductase flavoprotein subunit